MRDLFLDIRLGLRRLLKRPGYALVAVMVLGVGIGANTAIFSVVDALLLHPFAFPDPARLVVIWAMRNGDRSTASYPDVRDWQNQDQLFEGLAVYRSWDVNLTGAGAPERLSGYRVSTNFFQTLGAQIKLGRDFLPEEGNPGNNLSAILSHAFWQTHFSEEASALGRSIQLDGQAFTIVGVLPAHMEWPTGADIWVPLEVGPEEAYDRKRDTLMVVGRLKPGNSLANAQAELDVMARRLEQEYPETNTGRGARVVLLRDEDPETEEMIKSFLVVLFGAAAFVLLIGCANVANLQIAVATRRQTETAVRSALGASRWRVIRELLAESAIVGILGGVVGALLAWWGVYLIKANLPSEQAKFIPGFSQIRLNGRALAFTLAAALLSGILSGLAPATSASKIDLNQALKGGGRSVSGGRRRTRLRAALVVGEVALAVILLSGTGLMVRSFVELLNNPKEKYEPQSLLTVRFELPKIRYPSQSRKASFYTNVLDQIHAMPEVASLGLVSYLPMSGDSNTVGFCIEGKTPNSRAERLRADLESVSPGYFSTLRIPLEDGRLFGDEDGESTTPVAIVSRSVAERFWPTTIPLGHRLKLGSCDGEGPWRSIVGVVGDVKQLLLDREPQRTLYLPYPQLAPGEMSLVVRDGSNPLALAPEIRSRIAGLDSEGTTFVANSLDEVINDSVAGVGMATALIGSFGMVALILAAIGIYGLVSNSVTERSYEFGIRMALGAQPVDVRRLVVVHALRLGCVGLAIGIPMALLLGRAMTSLLFGLGTIDPFSLLGAALLLVATAFLSGYFPALRASRTSPLEVLRRIV